MPGPISPGDVVAAKTASIPESVFEIFNRLITEALDGREAVIRQDDVVREIEAAGISREEIYRKGYLNVEPAYRAAGWGVFYDKPGFNETGSATYTFSLSA